ncbi:hypothetical protein BJX61DRAFT_550338 [Aspergillus egyptiacus]|nr:hypothetical protein BJX61DRAFT_550338 [Aspergillus egyptiacus]
MPPEPFIPPEPIPSIPGSFPPTAAIPIAPPPWTLTAKAWIFLYTDVEPPTSGSQATAQNPNNNPDILQGILPEGAYHPFEVIHPSGLEQLANGSVPQFHRSWLKGVMILRYEETDVGPYDELILIPGPATNPVNEEKDMRISSIYVSTDASVWNGRRNWNIPKHRARFEFTPVANSNDLSLKVYHPEDAPAPLNPHLPFFTAILKDSSLPKLPLPRLASFALTQPPLCHPRYPDGVQDAVIATDDPENGRENPWLSIKPSFHGKWGLAYASRLEEGDGGETLEWHGDGVGFPRVKLWPVGAVFEGEVGFGAANVVS